MFEVAVADASSNRQLIDLLAEKGEMFANADSRHTRFDRSKFAPCLGRAIRLQVPEVLLARTAKQEDHDARLGLAEPSQATLFGSGRQPRRQPQGTDRAPAKPIAT